MQKGVTPTCKKRDIGLTRIYVTHDQVEAMALGDRIAVLNNGRIEEAGEVLFHRVKMRPGMPILADMIDEKPILCMPGDVTSCLVCGHVFLPPMIRRMVHLPFVGNVRRARLSEAVVSEYGMRRYLPVKLVDWVAYPTFGGSSLITSIGHADGFVVIGEDEALTEWEVDVRVL